MEEIKLENKTVLGKLKDTEASELLTLHMRKATLNELFVSVPEEREDIRQQIINDLTDVQLSMRKWWKKVSNSHSWEYSDTDIWSVDFTSMEVTLIHSEEEK